LAIGNFMLHLILYSKAGCHLCQGLEEKLRQIQPPLHSLEVRDISSRADWWASYEYEVPVLYGWQDSPEQAQLIPRPSPRSSVLQLQRLLGDFALDL
jgi:Glutaredoxin-like domain (DUF836)